MPEPATANRPARLAAIAVAVAALTVASCGGDDPGAEGDADAGGAATAPAVESGPETEAPAGTAVIEADPSGALAYLHDDVTVSASKGDRVTVELDNPSEVVHDVTIERDGKRLGATDRVTAGDAKTKLRLEPGSYTFYCSVTGHRTAGMEGTFEVE